MKSISGSSVHIIILVTAGSIAFTCISSEHIFFIKKIMPRAFFHLLSLAVEWLNNILNVWETAKLRIAVIFVKRISSNQTALPFGSNSYLFLLQLSSHHVILTIWTSGVFCFLTYLLQYDKLELQSFISLAFVNLLNWIWNQWLHLRFKQFTILRFTSSLFWHFIHIALTLGFFYPCFDYYLIFWFVFTCCLLVALFDHFITFLIW